MDKQKEKKKAKKKIKCEARLNAAQNKKRAALKLSPLPLCYLLGFAKLKPGKKAHTKSHEGRQRYSTQGIKQGSAPEC